MTLSHLQPVLGRETGVQKRLRIGLSVASFNSPCVLGAKPQWRRNGGGRGKKGPMGKEGREKFHTVGLIEVEIAVRTR